MSARTGSHQLSNGLMVSGRPEHQLKERQPTLASRAVPYTGGDVKKSGELGKMYGIDLSSGDHLHHHPPAPPKLPSRQPSSSQHNSGSARSGPNSGQMGPKSTNSGPMSKKSSSSSFSGPMTPIQPTGLITSGPLGSSSSNRRSGQLDAQPAPSSFNKAVHGSAVTSLGEAVKLGFRVSRVAMWVFLVVVVMGLVVGAFLMAAVKKPMILVVAAALLVPAVVILIWNYAI
ncbi:UNVERIFIED_CONTAM: putative membrane protein [Sesamum radiatum]|uniref:Membrane protein n=1 Tax=Sesamum radiatum TaxID=300843 RepID=A0AAW2KHQ5_SESRA